MEQLEEGNMYKAVPVKYLLFAVDGTAATEPHWKTIFSDYLERIIRNFDRKVEQNPETMLWFGMVVYLNREPEHAGCAVESYRWTRDVNLFLRQLSCLTFSGGNGLNAAGIAEGLNEALVLFPKPQVDAHDMFVAQYLATERHCVLVASSNPFVLPATLESPVLKDGQIRDLQTEYRTVVVDDVAKMFAKSSTSLSVISPKHLPSLKQIFNVGNGITDQEVPSADNEEYYNPHEYLVLLSEKFPDIHTAFKEEQTMMMRSPSPASVEAQANFMDTDQPRSGNHITDEDMEAIDTMLHDPTIDMQQDNIYPEEIFNIMPGVIPQVLVLSNDLVRELSSPELNDYVASNFDNDRMRYEAILSDFMGAAASNLNQEQQTLPTNGGSETLAHGNLMISAPVQALELERIMFMPRDMDQNDAPPLMITETLPSRPQLFYNFMPGELEMVRQNSGQVTVDSTIISSVPSINSDVNTSNPVGLQTAYTEQVSSEPFMLSTGVSSGAILEVSGGEMQPFPGTFTGFETPNLAANSTDLQAANSGLAGNSTVHQAANSGFNGNSMVPQAANLDFAGNLMILRAANSGLAGNLTVLQAATPDLAGYFEDPQATDPGLAGNLMVPRETTPDLDEMLSLYEYTSSDFIDVPGPSSINGEFEPKSLAEIFGEDDGFDMNQIGFGSNTEGESIQLLLTTVASVIERYLEAHGRMDEIVFADLDKEQDGYVLSWQGNINAEHLGQIHSPGQAKAYRKLSAPASLTAEWPQTILVDQILRQKEVFGIPYVGEIDILVFATMANRGLHEKLKNEELCFRMDLPSRTMIFLPTERTDRFFCALFHGHIPVFTPDRSVQQPVALLVPNQELDITYDSALGGTTVLTTDGSVRQPVAKQEPDTEDNAPGGMTTDCVMRDEEVEKPEGTNNQP